MGLRFQYPVGGLEYHRLHFSTTLSHFNDAKWIVYWMFSESFNFKIRSPVLLYFPIIINGRILAQQKIERWSRPTSCYFDITRVEVKYVTNVPDYLRT